MSCFLFGLVKCFGLGVGLIVREHDDRCRRAQVLVFQPTAAI
jgi:hypothetical protein